MKNKYSWEFSKSAFSLEVFFVRITFGSVVTTLPLNLDMTVQVMIYYRKPWLARRRRKDDEQLTSSRASGNNSAVSGSTGASSKLSGVGVPGAESGGSPAGGGSGSGGGTSATAVGQFDLEASAFPPLPGLEQPATATSKHHHHHHHHYPHHHHHHASGSGGSANTSTATTTTGSNAQADAVTVDQPAPSSHWGENRYFNFFYILNKL